MPSWRAAATRPTTEGLVQDGRRRRLVVMKGSLGGETVQTGGYRLHGLVWNFSALTR